MIPQGVPELFEGCLKRSDQSWLDRDDQVFLIVARRASGPVVASGEQCLFVSQGKLVVHVKRTVIDPHRDPGAFEAVDIGAEILGLVVIGDDPNGDLSAMRFQDGFREPVVGDGEDANVDRRSRALEKLLDRSGTVVTWAKMRLGPRLGIHRFPSRLKHPDDLFEPVENGSVIPLRATVSRELEGSFAESRHVVGFERRNEVAERLPLASREVAVAEGLDETIFDFRGSHWGSPESEGERY